MVELSPANLEPGLEQPLSKPSEVFLKAVHTLAWPVNAGGSPGQVTEVSATPTCSSSLQHLDVSC